MENIVAHSLEKLYTEFEKADQLFLDSGMKDMDAYEKGLAEAARRAAAEHMQALYNSMDRMLCDDICFHIGNSGARRAYICHARIVKSQLLSESVVSAAAYQNGEKLFSEYDQEQKYYPYKNEVTHKEIMLPSHVSPEFADCNTLWNSAEAQEKQGNSQLKERLGHEKIQTILGTYEHLNPRQQS